MTSSPTHFVLMPSYNTGPRLRSVVAEVLQHWRPVLVVIDGSTDGSERGVLELAAQDSGLTVIVRPTNGGKGDAVIAGAIAARERGLTHALVMDADGQHPTASIAEFMEVSMRRPEAMVLGQPVFPANIPRERLHGRKLSTGMVYLEMMGPAVADALFGFRVYPLAPLLAALESRRTGRRYDFDTEAAVRMGWAGVPPVNVPAPVRYFSRAEGGVSHFHYLRDNLTLIGLHTRLLIELIFLRWPSLLRHRRSWRIAGLVTLLLTAGWLHAEEADPLVNPAHRLEAGAPTWTDLATALRTRPDARAGFVERRYFPFKKTPAELQGEVRVSASRGLSLHYTAPEERIVILDEKGLLVRGPGGEQRPPDDPRAAPANDALRHVLRLDFAALEKDFDLFGESWARCRSASRRKPPR